MTTASGLSYVSEGAVAVMLSLKLKPHAEPQVFRLESGGYLHVFCGDLVKALCQLRDQILVLTDQEAADLFGDPSIVEQALSGGGRERRGQRQLV